MHDIQLISLQFKQKRNLVSHNSHDYFILSGNVLAGHADPVTQENACVRKNPILQIAHSLYPLHWLQLLIIGHG